MAQPSTFCRRASYSAFEPQGSWSTRSLAVRPGDRLIFLGDGVAETSSPQGDWFGRALAREVERLPAFAELEPDNKRRKAGAAGRDLEVMRVPGYFEPPEFLAMFRFVGTKAYQSMSFGDYLANVGG